MRRDGVGVATPVWFVPYEDGIAVWTGGRSGKVRRIRRDPNVQFACCDRRGRLLGNYRPAVARLLPASAGQLVQQLLVRKYGLEKRGLDLYNRLRSVWARPAAAATYILIVPSRTAGSVSSGLSSNEEARPSCADLPDLA